MSHTSRYTFKRAEAGSEFAQIHRLNYRTFVEEIPQHATGRGGRLIDKFHAKNTYFVALCDRRVVGMLSVHDRPPFSVASRLADPSVLKTAGGRPLEIRLLAVEPEHRSGQVLAGLLCSALEHARDRYSDVYISGVAQRVRMYERLGFRPLGPPVDEGCAAFVPMHARLPLDAKVEKLARTWNARLGRSGRGGAREKAPPRRGKGPARGTRPSSGDQETSTTRGACERIGLLPGPVAVSPAVRAAFESRPVNHRQPEFIDRFERVRAALGRLVGGRQVALLHGSGTLANEAIAAALAAEITTTGNSRSADRAQRGLILVNGEFGARLVIQAARFGLRPRVLDWKWGQPWNLEQVEAALEGAPAVSWVWGVHLESSTGVVNDLGGLTRIAQRRGVRVCVDCVSSLGAVPLDLSQVYLASGTSGKSLGSYAGIAMVFADRANLARMDATRLPRYLDLGCALETRGPRFTFSSSTTAALETALGDYGSRRLALARYGRYARLGAYVRGQLHKLGVRPLAADAVAAPVLTTFRPPGGESTRSFVERCRTAGFDIGGESRYLARRGLAQIATMGATTRADVAAFFESPSGRLVE